MSHQTPCCAGASRADITPAVGTLLYGYNPDQKSTSVHDPLHLTALAVGNTPADTLLLITITAGDLQTALAYELRREASAASGVPADQVLVSVTHTHSAPNIAGMEGWGGIDRPYVDDILLPALKKAAAEAVSAMVPAEYAVGETRSEVGINRRQLEADGSIVLGQNPWGCFDPTMTCMSIRRADDKRGILNLMHYGCHGTSAGCNHEITRDWSGVMTDRMEEETGVMTAFWDGAQGDVGPRLTNGQTVGNIHHVEELGGIAARDGMHAWQALGVWQPLTLHLYKGDLRVPYKPLPTLAEVEKTLASYENPEELINIEKLTYAHYCEVRDVLLSGRTDFPTHWVWPQTMAALGDVFVVPFPFEIFSEISLRLRRHLPFAHVLALTNTNGYRAYLPSEDQIVRGGYEIEYFLYCGAFTFVNNADQILLDETLRIVKEAD